MSLIFIKKARLDLCITKYTHIDKHNLLYPKEICNSFILKLEVQKHLSHNAHEYIKQVTHSKPVTPGGHRINYYQHL